MSSFAGISCVTVSCGTVISFMDTNVVAPTTRNTKAAKRIFIIRDMGFASSCVVIHSCLNRVCIYSKTISFLKVIAY